MREWDVWRGCISRLTWIHDLNQNFKMQQKKKKKKEKKEKKKKEKQRSY